MTLGNLLQVHPYLISIVGTFILNNVLTALVSNLPAPTKDSSVKYVYWFKVCNSIVGNLQRAKSTAIETSPNFLDALKAQTSAVPQVPPARSPIPTQGQKQ